MNTMHTRKLMLYINLTSWRTFLLQCITIGLISSSQCKAQCSVPPARFEASTEPSSAHSPNHPDSYPDDTACSWLINSPTDTGRIQLRVVQDDFSCCCSQDYLLIKDGANSSVRPIAILCSKLDPVTITSSGPSLYGEFRSDGDGNTGLGYTLQFDYFDSEVSCPSGWTERNGNCYKLYMEELPWQRAASRCGYDGGFLTSVADQEENNFLVGSFQDQSSLSWIGMDSAGNWLDGSSSLFYSNFLGESTSASQCSVIDLDSNGRWTVLDCINQQLTFICKKTRDGSGGRYWTEIALDEGGSKALNIIIACILFPVLCCLGVCCNKANRRNDYQLIRESLTCLRECMSACFGAVRRGIGHCFSCRCFRPTQGRNESNDARRDSLSIGTEELRYRHDRVSLDDVRISSRSVSSESGHRSRRASATSGPPPTYGDATSEPPPPSYTEALDTTFDISSRDIIGSRTSVNISQAIAAPSYASMYGFETQI